MLVDYTYNRETQPNPCLSNDKCSVLREWKYSGGTIKSVGEKAGYPCWAHKTLGWKWTFTDFGVTFGAGSL